VCVKGFGTDMNTSTKEGTSG